MTAPTGSRPGPPAGSDEPREPGGPDPRGRWRAWWPRAERRRRSDLVVMAAIVVAAVVGTLLVLRTGDEASTTLSEAATPIPPPSTGTVPTALVEAWRAPDPAGTPPGAELTGGPVTASGAVATGGTDSDGTGVVRGLDPTTGAVAWEYRRPDPLCTLGAGFGDVLAVFATDSPVGTYCSEVQAFEPSTGERGPSRSADVRPGTRLLSDEAHMTATGTDYLEVWRNDLVSTLEYGRLPTPVQSSPQPRAGCAHVSIAAGSGSVAVLERCPGEQSDRLSVLSATPTDYDKPEDRFSVPAGLVGGQVVATTGSRTAVEAPDGTLRIYDESGSPIGSSPLGAAAGPLPDSAATDPAGQSTGVRTAGPVLLWWTGRATVALDPVTLVPRWTLLGTLGPGAAVPTGDLGTPTTALVPVASGLAPVDTATGASRPLVAVDRSRDAAGPIGVGVVGNTVVEQRGGEIVGLRPPG